MVLKRSLGDEELCDYPWKQPRQMQCSDQLPSFEESVSRTDVSQKSLVSDSEGEEVLKKCQYEDRHMPETSRAEKEFDTSAPTSISSWVNGSTSVKDLKSEAAICFSYFPGIFEHSHPTRLHTEDENIYSSVFDFRPRKLVSIGPDHQAHIPECRVDSMKNDLGSVSTEAPSTSLSEPLGANQNIDDSGKMMGICVLPMPDSEASHHGEDKVGKGRTDCSCEDEGSIRCVRQHIKEAREKLIRTLGMQTFEELGFFEMGEEVARKWTEEDEHVFSEVVFSNPASLRRNFWDHLSAVFSSRTKREIVSYYFNVFVLRRRSEQNRLDPLNVDSDNDEWDGSDDGDDEIRVTQEDDDSVIESPEEEGYPLHRKHSDGVDGADGESCANNVTSDCGDDRVENNYFSEACYGKSPIDCSSDPVYPMKYDEANEHQDDSCTSYDCQFSRADSYPAASQECCIENDHSKHFRNSFNGLSSVSGLGYDIEPCATKAWDVEFLSSFKTDVDLLPTSNMIEEVFGDGAWNN